MLQILNKMLSVTPLIFSHAGSRIIGAALVPCIRTVSSKPGRLKPRKYKNKFRGLKTPDSTYVTAGTQVVTQRGLLYFPGCNVGIGRNFTLFAMEHGRVFVTTEKVNPNWQHSFIKRFYKDYEGTDTAIYKTYVHVIAAPMPNKFKLVDQI